MTTINTIAFSDEDRGMITTAVSHAIDVLLWLAPAAPTLNRLGELRRELAGHGPVPAEYSVAAAVALRVLADAWRGAGLSSDAADALRVRLDAITEARSAA